MGDGHGTDGVATVPGGDDMLGPRGAPTGNLRGHVSNSMPEILTESFCERCGTKYALDAPEKKRTDKKGVKKARVFARGLKNFVLSDEPLEDAIAAAEFEEGRAAANEQLEAFHELFNFCMECRQYTCANCWNQEEGRCLSCAPAPGRYDPLLSLTQDSPLPTLTAALGTNGTEPGKAEMEATAWPTADLPVVEEPAAIEEPDADIPHWLVEGTPEPAGEAGGEMGEEAPALESPIPMADATAPVALEPLVEEPLVVEPVEAAPQPTAVQPEPGPVAAEAMADQPTEAFAPEPPLVAEPLEPVAPPAQAAPPPPHVEPSRAEWPEPQGIDDGEPMHVASAGGPEGPSWFDQLLAEPPAPAPEPVVVAPEPQPEPVVAEAPEPVAAEPEPIAAEAEPAVAEAPQPAPEPQTLAPEREPVAAEPPAPAPEPVAAEAVAPLPEPEPELVEAAPEPLPAWDLVAPEAPAEEPAPVWPPRAPVYQPPPPSAAPTPTQPPVAPSVPPQVMARQVQQARGMLPVRDASAVWEESTRGLIERPGSGVQPCTSCGLALSASARFCRRCGTRQG
jgi:nicotinate-nucleotide--dimethylbenzimidazole phosphoribosyltransferase